MPAPTASQLKELTKVQFRKFAIKLPMDWQNPSSNTARQQFTDAFEESERSVTIPSCPPGLFIAATANKAHCDTARQISDQFHDYIDGVCDAIASAWDNWQKAASITGVVVNAVVASGGQIVGPPLEPLILAKAPKSTEKLAAYSAAIAGAIGTAWQQYQSSISIPGLPVFPSFAAFPGPVAPPTPNVPIPLISLTQVTVPLQQAMLKRSMIAKLGDPRAQHHQELLGSIADAVAKSFTQWQASTKITNLIGTGPIPSFAPPFVPVGPVVMGSAVMAPGGIT